MTTFSGCLWEDMVAESCLKITWMQGEMGMGRDIASQALSMLLGGSGKPGAAPYALLSAIPSNPCSKPHSHQESFKLVNFKILSPLSLTEITARGVTCCETDVRG